MRGYYDSFISSTYWTEGVGFAAAKATLEKMQRIDLPAHAEHIGRRVTEMWLRNARRHGVPVAQDGDIFGFPGFNFLHAKAGPLATLYSQLMLDHGMLASNTMFICYAHTDKELDEYETAMDPVMAELAKAIDADDIEDRLVAGEARAGFGRLN